MMQPSAQLLDTPDWGGAAQALIDGCTHLPSSEARIEFLDGACRALGDALYPAFLQVLLLISNRALAPAQAAVAETLADALGCGRLPATHPAAPNPLSSSFLLGASEQPPLGPIEFLCAWYVQPPLGSDNLSASSFEQKLKPLMSLIAHSERAHKMYTEHLKNIAQDKLGGGWHKDARIALEDFAHRWITHPEEPEVAINSFIRQAKTPAQNETLSSFGVPLSSSWPHL